MVKLKFAKKTYLGFPKRSRYLYFLTCKKLSGKCPTVEDYERFFKRSEKTDLAYDYCYELGKQKRLHLHLILESAKKYDVTDFLEDDYNIDLTFIKDKEHLLTLTQQYFLKEKVFTEPDEPFESQDFSRINRGTCLFDDEGPPSPVETPESHREEDYGDMFEDCGNSSKNNQKLFDAIDSEQFEGTAPAMDTETANEMIDEYYGVRYGRP